jgi:hypothetical protein
MLGMVILVWAGNSLVEAMIACVMGLVRAHFIPKWTIFPSEAKKVSSFRKTYKKSRTEVL